MVIPTFQDFILRITFVCCFILIPLSIDVCAQSGKLPTMGQATSWIQGWMPEYIQQKMMDKEEEYEFPDNLEGFGLEFNEDGELRTIETDEAFEFNEKEGNYNYNQQRYNAIGEIVTNYIYNIMEKEHRLQRTFVPLDAAPGEAQSFVFHTGNLYQAEKLMILIHGSGAVRAGQWARRLIINDALEEGSQLPYIKWALEQGFAVLVANTNINHAEPDPKNKKKPPQKIRGNGSPEEHMESLWRDFVQRCAAKHIAIVAHSYGGVCVLELAKRHLREFEERVFAVCLTDSVHGMRQQEIAPDIVQLYKGITVNWASAYDDLDEPLITAKEDVPTVSAGTDRHESTSYTSMQSIFKYITRRFDEKMDPNMEKFVVPKREPPPEDQPPVNRREYWAKKEAEKQAREEEKKIRRKARREEKARLEKERLEKEKKEKEQLEQEQAQAAAQTEQTEKTPNADQSSGASNLAMEKDDDDALIDLSDVKSEL